MILPAPLLALLAPAPSPCSVSLSPLRWSYAVRRETELDERGRDVKWAQGLS